MTYEIHHYDQLDSTNDQAKRIAKDTPREGGVVIADEQTKGKGRMGRSWHSEDKSGVYMSIILTPSLDLAKAPQITLITGIAVCRAINKITGLDILIKWPNDVLANEKKLSGILLETSLQTNADKQPTIKYIVVGIGINVSGEYFPGLLKDKATSVLLETGREYPREEIIHEILEQFDKVYNTYMRSGFKEFAGEYKKMCVTLGKTIKVVYKNGEFIGDAVDISYDGELLVKTDDGRIVKINSGEVSVRSENDEYV